MKKIIPVFAFALISMTALAKPETFKVDTSASSAEWEGKKVGGAHNGELKIKSGQVELEKGALVGGTIEIDMTTLKNVDIKDAESNTKLINHLKSDDFFSIEKFPTASLKITKSEKQSDGKFKVSGNLIIKGKTQPISFPVEMTTEKAGIKASGEMKVDRTLYDIRYRSSKFFSSLGDKVIHDEFTVRVKLIAKK